MREPWCATYRVGSINCDGNAWYRFKTSPTCCWITWTASSTTAAPKYASEWWKPSTATSKPYLEGAAATRISATCCSRPSAWQSPRPNSSCFRKQPKMRVSTNSCAETNLSGELFDGIAAADHSALQNAAQHATPSAKLFAKSGTNCFHLVTGGAYRTDFQTRSADLELLANLQVIYAHTIGCNVFADDSRPEIHGLQGLAIHEQDLALASGPRVSAVFEAGVAHSTNFGKFLHRQVLLRSAEKILHARHGLSSPAAFS